ncbi:MAG: hypothetical protein CTY15_07440 [Methylocystis sp.]|nr:MAG: hypothetical protein CTY15_07440 [Methylocystis sp.]
MSISYHCLRFMNFKAMKYQRIPFEVEAWQFQGSLDFAPGWIARDLVRIKPGSKAVTVITPEGEAAALPGDWLVHDGSALFVLEETYFATHFQKIGEGA